MNFAPLFIDAHEDIDYHKLFPERFNEFYLRDLNQKGYNAGLLQHVNASLLDCF